VEKAWRGYSLQTTPAESVWWTAAIGRVML
jgi:hypothetical protein